mgnify:CR=1 FL=1|tara:strand:- start:78 stop:200 length:123 start_codon:yes stop_codon:yes gene_type:complete
MPSSGGKEKEMVLLIDLIDTSLSDLDDDVDNALDPDEGRG